MWGLESFLTQTVALLAMSAIQCLLLGVVAVRTKRPPRRVRQYILNAPQEEEVAATHVAPPLPPVQVQPQQMTRAAWKAQMARRFGSA